MNVFRANWPRVVLGFILVVLVVRTEAADFGLGATVSPTGPLVLGNQLTYTIGITNLVGNFSEVFLTNAFSGDVIYNSSTNTTTASIQTFTNANTVIFQLFSFVGAGTLTVNVTPLSAGPLTNFISINAPGRTNVTTNVAVPVVTGQADLAVTITNATAGMFINDTTTIGVVVSNLGPTAAPAVVLSNTLPANFTLLSISPTNLAPIVSGTNYAFRLGTLASGSATQILFSVQATNATTNTLTASVSATNLWDTNSANDSASSTLVVSPFLAADLVAQVDSAQTYNPQTGLMEQRIQLINIGTNSVPAARVNVGGMTNWVCNAVGTNGGVPFVIYGATLQPGTNNSVQLLLEYFVPKRTAVPDPALTAVAIPAVDLAAPTNAAPNITKVLASGAGLLIEFQSIPGRSYTILYADDSNFRTNARTAQPVVVAPADRTQWIDSGPPKTVSVPASAASRYYRVLLNP